jgi:hypothetical protein
LLAPAVSTLEYTMGNCECSCSTVRPVEIDTVQVLNISKATRHPLKIATLLRLEEVERASPSELAQNFEQSVGVVVYHVNTLAHLGAIKEVAIVPVRGAAEHFYSLDEFGEAILLALRFALSPWPKPPDWDDNEERAAES